MRAPRYRKARRDNLRAQGITACNLARVVCFQVGNTAVLPKWLDKYIVHGLKPLPGQFWITPNGVFHLSVWLKAIYVPFSFTKTVLKRCESCNRPTIANEAYALQAKYETAKDRSTVECGPSCRRDRDTGIWERLGRVAA
jgi:hypothetical protein